MATQVSSLGLRLFLEGIEVPVISAQVSIQPASAATAAIQIVPTDSALLLLPRTLVHLFYLDNEFIDGTNADLLTSTARDGAGKPLRLKDDQNRFSVADEQYKLLFSGEIIGYNYQKTPTGRAMILQCLDFSSYWDTCYQWYAEYAVGGDGLTDVSHNFVGAGQYLFNDVAAGTKWVISNVLNSSPENPLYKDAGGLLAGYIHLLEVIGGIRPTKTGNYKAFRGVNDFFTIAELMYKLSGMIGAVAGDRTSQKIFANKAFRDWLKNGMASSGSLISFRDTIRIVGQYIFHETYPNPAAYYIPPGSTQTLRRPRTVTETNVGREVVTEVEQIRSQLRGVKDLLIVGSTITVSPADSTQVLGDTEVSLTDTANVISSSNGSDSARLGGLVRLAKAAVVSVRNRFNQAGGIQFDGSNYTFSLGVGQALAEELDIAIENLTQVVRGAATSRVVDSNVEVAVGEHLFNQLLLPETFFCSPPRCNVLFPDMYMSFGFNRNFLREVSRLSCAGGLGMIAQGSGTKILGRNYFAPNVKVQDKIVRDAVYASGTTLMPHEVHSGIIPKFEWVTDGHRWGVQAAKERGVTVKQNKINYIQRLANFQFFTHRWMARQMNVTGRFNPHLVIGFPGLIVDRTSPNIGALAAVGGKVNVSAALLPTAYLGKVATIQHNVHQNGGETSVVYTHARTHKGIDDEFLGLVRRESTDATIATVNVETQNIIDQLSQGLPLPDDLPKILMQLWIKGRLVQNSELYVGRVARIEGDDNADLEVTEAQARLFGVSSDDVLSLATRQQGGPVPQGGNVFLPSLLQVQIEFRAGEGLAQPVEAGGPFEQIVRPGWYAPQVWDNANITSQVYAPLLGSSSITDDLSFQDTEEFANLIRTAIKNSAGDTSNITVETTDTAFLIEVDGVTAASLPTSGDAVSIESAVDGLTMLYGIVRKGGQNVQQFIDDYVKRPVANMVQILGDSDFQLDPDGEPTARADGTLPFEGFHSRAFGPYNTNVQLRAQTRESDTPPKAGDGALRGLIPASKEQEFNETGTIIRRSKDGKKVSRTSTAVPKHLDPRGRAQSRVRVYVDELRYTRGILAT